ncbi:hypothetical protein [Oligoflexus tunisiensis]|uniref:hypothetical protein n=1 Tax=Oligoflexus tunisiensis TaxID=708132 RepID=UPI00114CB787|nr:hypothetical protein [Oligoflexus tunisiensis]
MLKKAFLSIMALAMMGTSCHSGNPDSTTKESPPPSHNLGQALIDSTLLEVRMFQISGERSQALQDLPKSFPVLIINQKKKAADGTENYEPIGFAINCKGRDPRAVVNAFGEAFLETDHPELITEEELEALFQVSRQPILRCDALQGSLQTTPMFSQVFRVIDQAGGKVHHLVRFHAASPLDKRLFEIGCQNIMDAFGQPQGGSIPVLKESLKDLPGADDPGALHCFNTASALPHNLSIPVHPAEEYPFDARLYRVQDKELGLLRVLLTGGKAFRLNCSAADSELQKAFGFPETGKLDTITVDDEAFADYLNGRMEDQPVFHCPSVSRPEFASDAYRISNQGHQDPQAALRNPLMRLKTAEDTLVQFSCDTAARFFAGRLIDRLITEPGLLQNMTLESRDYLVRKYVPGQLKTRKYRIGCASDAMGPKPEDIQTAFQQVFGVRANEAWITQKAAEIKAQLSSFHLKDIVNYFVQGMAMSEFEVKNITERAFRKAKNREAWPEEKAFFADWILQQKKLRPHHDELVAYLGRVKELSREELIRSYMDVMNNASADGIAWWAGEFMSHPDKTYTYESVVSSHISWLMLDENTGALDHIIRMAYKAALQWDIDSTCQEKIRNWIKKDRVVRAHYKELIGFIKQRALELIPGPHAYFEALRTTNFRFTNNCRGHIDLVLRLVTTSNRWEIRNFTVAQGATVAIDSNGRYVHWFARSPATGFESWGDRLTVTDVQVPYQNGWKKTYRYDLKGGEGGWASQSVQCS